MFVWCEATMFAVLAFISLFGPMGCQDAGCPRGTYRAVSASTCQPCPANTNISLSGGRAAVCPCLKRFFRTSEEGPDDQCSSPPSTCRNIRVQLRTEKSVVLSWTKPDNIGRSDFYYLIEYTDGATTGEHTLISGVDEVQDVISGLKPATTYLFTVTTHNGVSDQDTMNEHLRRCELRAATQEGVPSTPLDVRGFCSAVVWRMSSTPNGKIVGYDVRLKFRETREVVVLTAKSDRTFAVVEEIYQQSGINVQVRARTSAGAGEWSQETLLGCKETPTPAVATCSPCSCPASDCPDPTTEPPIEGVHFILNNEAYPNNSVVSLASVGEGDGALICRTDREDCCGTLPNRFGEFYYPSGVQVPVNRLGQGFYRNRGNQEIHLNRRGGIVSPLGRFRCEIPDSNGVTQNIFITLV